MSATHQSHSTCSADELIGLCDEIAALIRAGIPLEETLHGLGHSRRHSRRLTMHVRGLVERLGTGRSLAEAIRSDPFFPPVYAAVVAAGIESGNLAAALETVAENTRKLRDARVFIVRTTFYPVLLLSVLWTILGGLVFFLIPPFAAFFENFDIRFPLIGGMNWLMDDPWRFVYVVLGGLFVFWTIYLVWVIGTRRVHSLQGSSSVFAPIPWIGRAQRELQKASFVRLLAMLLNYELPLERAILLAAQATDVHALPKALDRTVVYVPTQNGTPATGTATSTASRPDLGESEEEIDYPRSPISPVIRWVRTVRGTTLIREGLDQYAMIAERMARMQFDRCELWFPVLTLFVVSLAVVSAYFVAVVWPYGSILHTVLELK